MSILSQISQKIEDQQWDHVRFLRNLLLILGIVILFFYTWILILNLNEVIDPNYFVNTLRDMIRGHLIGIIAGLVGGFLILMPYYYRKQWDLHIVVPNSLFIHLLAAAVIFLFNSLTSIFSPLFESAILMGYLVGGLIAILAYAGEVKKEHQNRSVDENKEENKN